MVVGDGDFAFSRQLAAWAMQASPGGSVCTSVLQDREGVMRRYAPFGDALRNNLAWFRVQGVAHRFGVDATRMADTSGWARKERCDAVIWTYPFPESNAVEVSAKRELLDAFFASVRTWPCFAPGGVVVLGLKSRSATRRHCTDDEDFQLTHWGVEAAAARRGFGIVGTLRPTRPFWTPTSVCGRAMCRQKEISIGAVQVKFYAFAAHRPSRAP